MGISDIDHPQIHHRCGYEPSGWFYDIAILTLSSQIEDPCVSSWFASDQFGSIIFEILSQLAGTSNRNREIVYLYRNISWLKIIIG